MLVYYALCASRKCKLAAHEQRNVVIVVTVVTGKRQCVAMQSGVWHSATGRGTRLWRSFGSSRF